MKLAKSVIDKLLTDRAFRLKLAVALEFSEVWINRLIDANKKNGPLTTLKALEIIRNELKIPDSKILEGTGSEVKEGIAKVMVKR